VLQVPPLAELLNEVVLPAQTVAVPVIAPALGSGLTVTICVATAVPQLFVTVYDIIAVPADMPVTIPVVLAIAMPTAPVLQIPPLAELLNEVVLPAQTVAVPVMVPASGSGLTVTICVATAVPQLFVTVYDIVAVPADTPVTTPLVLTVAIPEAPVLHVPPLTELLNVVVLPAQTVAMPVIAPASGSGLTVTICVVTAVPQLFVTVYDIIAVPADMPVTTPLVLTVAIPAVPVLQVPPLAELLSVVVLPAQTVAVPVIVPASGSGLTVTI
jgi:hypothetical protein